MPRNFIVPETGMKTLYDENNYTKVILDNGLTLVSQHMPHLRSVSIGVWITAGSRFESADTMGIFHFIEHCVFKGTKHRSALQIAKSLENVGGSINAFTSKEHTCFYANILSEDLALAVDVLADLVIHARFDAKEINREKQVILEEIRDTEDTPEEFVQDYFYGQVYRNHPMGYNILGTPQSVKVLDRKSIVDTYRKYYVPSNMVVSVAGNFDETKLQSVIAKKFVFPKSLRNTSYWPTGFEKYAIRNTPSKTEVVEKKINQAHVCIGVTIHESYTDDHRFEYLVLNTVLGGGMSSRLFQKIREKMGLAYSIYSFVDFLNDGGIFGVYWATDKNQVQKSVDTVKAELRKLADKPITAGELRMAKAQIKANLLFGLESTSTRMIRLAKNEIYLGKKVNIGEITKLIDRLTIRDIQKTGNTLAKLVDKMQISIVQ